MRRIGAFVCIACIVSMLHACSFVGETDYTMFEERFNKTNNDVQLISSNVICEEQDEKTKYDCFFDAKNGGKYLMTIYEKKDENILTSCTLCILSSIKLDINSIKDLFCSMLYAYAQIDSEKSEEIFNKLKLNEEGTYKKAGTITNEFDGLNVHVLVNGAGTAITIN